MASPARLLKVLAIIAAALVVGLVGRSLVGEEAAENPLVNWLPWLNRTEVTLYFGDASGEYLVPVSRSLSRRSEPVALVSALLEGPAEGTGLTNLVPEGTDIGSVRHVESRLEVYLVGDQARIESPLTSQALVHSLASWPGVEEVLITVAGRPLDAPVTPGNLLYWYDEARDMLVARPTSADSPAGLVAAYLDGPDAPHLTGLPDDVEVRTLNFMADRGLLAVDFTYLPSVRRYAVDHPEETRRVLEGLLATLTTGLPGVDAVWLDFEGREALGVGRCADLLRSAQTRPDTLNDERLLKRRAGAT